MPTSNNTTIHSLLEAMNRKIDDLIATLPNTYVTIRSHDIHIKTHEEKIEEAHRRIKDLELWRAESTAWANTQHMEMRREWTQEIKDVNTRLVDMGTTMSTFTERVSTLIKILLWIAGGGGVSSIIIALIIAWLTHIIH